MVERLKTGVRELVEFCCRDGDLGADDGPGVDAIDGLRVHQRIQRRYHGEAEAEVAIRLVVELDGAEIELGGRIDLWFAADSPPRIEEIKTVTSARAADDQSDAVHWAQLMCYGAAIAREHALERVELSLNRVNLWSGDERRARRQYARRELEDFVSGILSTWLRWRRRVDDRRRRLGEQARAMPFPFADYRAQQKKFAAEVYRAARDGAQLLVEAPTGSGKTLSVLFPALKALGEEQCDQVIYLTAKVSGQQQALATLELLAADASCLVLQAKARACPCAVDDAEVDDDGRCRRCIGFWARLPAAREELLGARRLDSERIQRAAADHGLCPFELALQMLPWVDVVVCDLNYAFDPLVQLGYFRADTRRKLLLIDELHNLVDRARGMYSARLARGAIRRAKAAGNSRAVGLALDSLQRTLDRVLRALPADDTVGDAVPEDLPRACARFAEKIGSEVFGNPRIAGETRELAREVFRFRAIAQLFGRHHRALGRRPVESRALRLACLNAFEHLRDCYPLFSAVCGFSATLSPADYFCRALGFDADCRRLRLESSFPPARLAVRIGDYIDTRYRQRDGQVEAICAAIAACYRARPGNYLVFFSAYRFMQQVHDEFARRHPGVRTLLQQREFDDDAQRRFLAALFETREQLGFAILGGRFAEGIDFRGEALIGAIIVGVGLPQADTLQELIREDFSALGLDGFDYAYRFPGLIRVQQSAGRVIRDERDRGVVVLLERRFRQPGYAAHLPRHWAPEYCHGRESLEQSLLDFWQRAEHDDGAD